MNVFEIAPAKVLHGAVRLHGLASLPVPDTHVRVACAWASEERAKVKATKAKVWTVKRNLLICIKLLSSVRGSTLIR